MNITLEDLIRWYDKYGITVTINDGKIADIDFDEKEKQLSQYFGER